MSRKVVAHLFNSVNGVVESPHEWQFDAFGPDEMQLMDDTITPVTDVIIGRKLWQEWAAYWPTAEDEFGQFINPVRKHVLASGLTDVSAWENSVLVEQDAGEYIRALKDNDATGDISVTGGIETVRSLFLAGLIDELILTTHPVVGKGRRLFDDSVPVTRLELVSARATAAGNVLQVYRLRP